MKTPQAINPNIMRFIAFKSFKNEIYITRHLFIYHFVYDHHRTYILSLITIAFLCCFCSLAIIKFTYHTPAQNKCNNNHNKNL